MTRSLAITALSTIGFLMLESGCEKERYSQSMQLGGKEVSAAQLNRGWEGYMLYCYACHGERGDGKGPSSPGLRPPPRDFTQGLFKFGGVAAPALPPDTELFRIVRGGLHGTAMLEWQVPEETLKDILQYLKTFSPRWKTDEVGKPIEMSADPFGEGKRAEAVALGRKLYHAKAQCSGCHPSFVTHEELHAMTKEMSGTGQTDFNPDMYFSQLKQSEYCLEWKPFQKIEERECAQPVLVMPPDFTRSNVRSGTTTKDLYRTIAAGIGGANMPTWKGALPEEEIWGLVYYVKSLIDLKGTTGATQLRSKLMNPANLSWKPAETVATPPKEGTKTAPSDAPSDKSEKGATKKG
jgi:mono/diheme cytochrome c family protein